MSAANDRDFPMIGETVGLWRLVAGLGRGGMGEVYEAEYDFIHILSLRYAPDRQQEVRDELAALPRPEQARLAAEVLGTVLPADARFAIKICNARSGTAGHRRFLQEAELAERLGDHPYIVGVHAVNGGIDAAAGAARRLELDRGRYRDVAFMVMDLATRTWDHTRLGIGEAVHIVRCIATALDHAHSRGVVHRDLKPENILGTVEHPLLTDFGIAKELEQDDGLTRTGQIIGTLDYMSPEQATDAKRVDHRSDIYSLGVVLYEFATGGHLPYSHKLDRESCLAAIRSERTPPRWPREHLAVFPAGLERIVMKAMAHRMEDRYQAMSDLVHDLDRFTRGEWIGLWGRVRLRDWLRFQTRFRPRTVWGLGLGTAGAAVLAVWLLVLPLFDARRNALIAQLDSYDAMVAAIRSRVQDQPDAVQHDGLVRIRGELADHRYPDLAARLAGIDRELRTHRRLRADFDSRSDGNLRGAQESLKRAAGIDRASWRIEADGLRADADLDLPLGEYGRGRACLALAVLALDWSRFSVEGHDPQRGLRLRWRVAEQRLLLEQLAADGRTALLREEPLGGSQLWLALEWNGATATSWVQGREAVRQHRVEAPAADSGIRWTLALPRGAVLRSVAAGGSW